MKLRREFPLLELPKEPVAEIAPAKMAAAIINTGPFDYSVVKVGVKPHVNMWVSPTLGTNGRNIALKILAASEIHYMKVGDFFKSRYRPKVDVILAPGNWAAGYHYVGLTQIYTSIQSARWDVSSAIYVAELVEIFAERQAKQWDAWSDHGEALSRWVMASVVPKTIGSLDTVPAWWNNGAPDYVTKAISSYSPNGIGCGYCFLEYLRSLNFKPDQIIAAGPASTLEMVFRKLTNSTGGYARMMKVLNAKYPKGTKLSGGLENDNLFRRIV